MEAQAQASDRVRAAGSLRITRLRGGVPVTITTAMPNKVVSSSGYGRNLIARALANDITYPLPITSAALGTGTNAASDSDTNLQTPTVTGLSVTNVTVTNNIVQVDVFVADGSLPNGTYKEFGVFCAGRLFARILITPNYTKASGEDTLFTYTLTLTG